MKEASYYEKLQDSVQCKLCPNLCKIKPQKLGTCKVRKNIEGKLYTLNYAKPVAVQIDPIEKKPLFHFLPGNKVLSIGTAGCNMSCQHCQNWHMSQAKAGQCKEDKLSPKKIIQIALDNECKIIAYTYNEPTIFFEYMLDCAKIAKENGIKNVIVSNGFICEEPLRELCKYIDAANIDLKAFNENFYKKICNARLKPVLESLKIIKQNNVWLEVTNLIIPTLNDSREEIEMMCSWIKNELGKDVPLHFSRFHPDYRLNDLGLTSEKTLQDAKNIAEKYLDFVYIGNIRTKNGENTYCPKCRKLLINRRGYFVQKDIKTKCCGEVIPGLWI